MEAVPARVHSDGVGRVQALYMEHSARKRQLAQQFISLKAHACRSDRHEYVYVQIDPAEGTLTFQPLGGSDVTTVIRTRQKVPQHRPVCMFEVHVMSAQAATPSSRIGAQSFCWLQVNIQQAT